MPAQTSPRRRSSRRRPPQTAAATMLAASVLAMCLAWGGCATPPGPAGATPAGGPLEGRPMTWAPVQRLDGQAVDWTALRGRVVLLDLWATWCKPCLSSLPFYESLQRELGPRGLSVVAVSVDTERAALEAFVRERSPTLTIGWDPSGDWPTRMNLQTMPTAFLIDRRGVVRRVHEGFQDGDGPVLRAAVEALVGHGPDGGR